MTHVRQVHEHPFNNQNLVDIQVHADGVFIRRARDGVILDGMWLENAEITQLVRLILRYEDAEHLMSMRT